MRIYKTSQSGLENELRIASYFQATIPLQYPGAQGIIQASTVVTTELWACQGWPFKATSRATSASKRERGMNGRSIGFFAVFIGASRASVGSGVGCAWKIAWPW